MKESTKKHIVSCPACGKDVLDHMTECPFCHAALRPKGYAGPQSEHYDQVRKWTRIGFVVAAVIAALWMIFSRIF